MGKEFELKEIFMIIGALAIGVILLVTVLTQKQPPKTEVDALKSSCDDITPPWYFSKTQQNDTVKPGIVSHSINYTSTASPEEVESYYVKLLTGSGWQHAKERDVLKFKKDKYRFNIWLPEFSLSTRRIYSVSCFIDAP